MVQINQQRACEAATRSLSADICCCSPSLQQWTAVALKCILILSAFNGYKRWASCLGHEVSGCRGDFFTVSMVTLLCVLMGWCFYNTKERQLGTPDRLRWWTALISSADPFTRSHSRHICEPLGQQSIEQIFTPRDLADSTSLQTTGH